MKKEDVKEEEVKEEEEEVKKEKVRKEEEEVKAAMNCLRYALQATRTTHQYCRIFWAPEHWGACSSEL